MASELQTKLYRSNEQFKYLSELMAQQIYPRLISAMKKLGMEEVRFDGTFNGWKTFCITIDGKLQFFSTPKEVDSLEKNGIYELCFSGKKECPLFSEDKNKSTKTFESPFPKYKSYCDAVIDKIDELEQNFDEASILIKRIENMGLFLERQVIIEKISNTH